MKKIKNGQLRIQDIAKKYGKKHVKVIKELKSFKKRLFNTSLNYEQLIMKNPFSDDETDINMDDEFFKF